MVLLSSLVLAPLSSQAIELNLLSVNLGSPESQKAQQMYGNAYGYTPQEVAPALLAPPEETPAILQIAKAAGTAPLGIWMMRKMGYSYPQIVSSYAIPPATLYGSSTPLGTLNPQHASPRWYSTLDPMFIELSRVYFSEKSFRSRSGFHRTYSLSWSRFVSLHHRALSSRSWLLAASWSG